MIEGAAFYEDRLVRTDAGWRFTHTGYERTFETSWSTASLPGWNLKRGKAFEVTGSSR